MYWHMQKGDEHTVNRGISLHKWYVYWLRLLSMAVIALWAMNWHPEWIDFPVKVTVGLMQICSRRQWNLVDNKSGISLYGDFDAAMLGVVKSIKNFRLLRSKKYGIMTVTRYWPICARTWFCIQLQPKQSLITVFLVPAGTYDYFEYDNPDYGGNGLTDDTIKHFTIHDPLYKKTRRSGWSFIPARTAVVLRRTK